MPAQIRMRRAAALLIVLVGLALRLHNIGFGLPSLYDPDEPIFMVIAAKLLSARTLNPGWFGHPGTTTIYLIALIDAGVYGVGVALGHYSSVAQFVHAAYADPGLLFLPARVAMALMGGCCVALTYFIGRRAWGTGAGLIAALLLAFNALHIAWSQVIRTDVHASLFMLAAVLFAMRFADGRRFRDCIISSLLVGFAIATKWPAITALAAVLGAIAYLVHEGAAGRWMAAKWATASIAVTLAGLFIASPFIFLDYPTVLSNLSGEARPFHLGHTGGGFGSNLVSYVQHEMIGSMGWIGFAFAIVGVGAIIARRGAARFVIFPPALAFLAVICGQKLVWSRWLIPELPFLCLFAAIGIAWAAERMSGRWPLLREPLLIGLLGGVAFLPTAAGALGQARERGHDTRRMAADWIVRHAAPGSTIALEHLELRLRDQPYRFLFPMGSAGCLDGKDLLRSGVHYDELDRLRHGSSIVDLGSVSPRRADTCRADYVILSYYDSYLKERARFPRELATYAAILSGGHTVALFRPEPGRIGGPIVRIVAVPRNQSR